MLRGLFFGIRRSFAHVDSRRHCDASPLSFDGIFSLQSDVLSASFAPQG